jgi:hypothetical protein
VTGLGWPGLRSPPDPGGQWLLARPAVGSDVKAGPNRPSPGNSFFGHGHRVYPDPSVEIKICSFVAIRYGQFGNEGTALSTGWPVSPGRKAGRGVSPRRGIFPRCGFVDRFALLRDRMGCSWWPARGALAKASERCKSAIADVIIFLGLVAFGSVIQRPGVGGGVQVGLGRGTGRATRYGPADGHEVRLHRMV